MAGLTSPQFLDRCTRCGWWKLWMVDFGGSWSATYPPSEFVKERHKKTGQTRVRHVDG